MKSHHMNVDVLVVGGGAAGIAAAVGAARNGSTVTLIERCGFLGGMATGALVGTICGLYFRSESKESRFICRGFPREFGQRLAKFSDMQPVKYINGLHFLPYEPFAFRRLADVIVSEEGIDLYLHTTMAGVDTQAGSVKSVHALAWDKPITIYPKSVVDCSGEATVAALAGGHTIESDCHQAAAIVFAMHGLKEIEPYSLQMLLFRELKRAISDGTLPADCERLSIVPGSHVGNRIYFKLGLPDKVGQDVNKMTLFEIRSRSLIFEMVRFLRSSISTFSDAILSEVASQVGVRTGRRPVALTTLTGKDVLSCRKFDDGIAKGGWPIEKWEAEPKPAMQYFSLDDYYEIPSHALRSKDFQNLLFAGRNISATDTAIASARVIGTCLGTGYAAGTMAAFQSQGKKFALAIPQIRKEQVTENNITNL